MNNVNNTNNNFMYSPINRNHVHNGNPNAPNSNWNHVANKNRNRMVINGNPPVS